MRRDEYVQFDALGLAELVHRKEVSPAELAAVAKAQISAINPLINAVVSENWECAERFAGGVETGAPFAGVPFLAKDMNVEVAGLPLTQSSRYFSDAADTPDSELAFRWRSAGLNIIGRTNTPEFAGDFVTEPSWRGPTLNPWDLTLTPGGSSGGAAAAVASGMVPVAHGSDSGGSIRVPAAACGLVGFKPSRGIVPSGPHHDEFAGGLNVDHVLARSVRDTAALLDATAGHALESRMFIPRPAQSYLAACASLPGTLTIGLCTKAPSGTQADDVMVNAVHEVARVLAGQGHHVKALDLGPDLDPLDTASVLWMSAIAEEILWHSRNREEPRRELFEALSWHSFKQAKAWSATDYVRARRHATSLTRALGQQLAEVDILLTPTTATLPVPVGSVDSRTDAFEFKAWSETAYRYAPFTELFNITGQPAISLPLGWTEAGFPIGVQLVGKLGQDALLLQVSQFLESAMPWSARLNSLLREWAKFDAATQNGKTSASANQLTY